MKQKNPKKENSILSKEEFYIPADTTYLNGHSLGLMCKESEKSMARVLHEWKTLGIGGWTHAEKPWFSYAEHLAGLLAQIIGAKKEEVIIHGTTTINLHVLLSAFYDSKSKRKGILVEEPIFPSDRYAIESFLRQRGIDSKKYLKFVQLNKDKLLEEKSIVEAMTSEIQMVILPSVLYQTAQLLDIQYLTKEAHKRGILIGFDLCHSIGIVPHELSRHTIDFAYFCTYKYLNAGPGSVGGLYVNKKHSKKKTGMAGWWGSNKENQFTMSPKFEPAYLAGGYQISTPHILSMAPLEGVLKMYKNNNINKIRSASLAMTDYLIELYDKELENLEFKLRTPRNEEQRGGSITLEHKYAASINKLLKKRGVVCDYREPNLLRITPNPLYVSKNEVTKTVAILKKIVVDKEYQLVKNMRDVVA